MSNTIESIRNLKENWDGYGAKPIPSEVCDNAEQILKLFSGSNVEIFPTAAETIQIEFNDGNWYFEIEVFSDSYSTYVEFWNSGECIEFPWKGET